MCICLKSLIVFVFISITVHCLCQEYINKECATLIWEVNMALAKDDIRSRCRLVVNIIKVTGYSYAPALMRQCKMAVIDELLFWRQILRRAFIC